MEKKYTLRIRYRLEAETMPYFTIISFYFRARSRGIDCGSSYGDIRLNTPDDVAITEQVKTEFHLLSRNEPLAQ